MDRYPERASRPTLGTPEKKKEVDTLVQKPQPTKETKKKGKKFSKQAALILIAVVVVLGLVWWFFLRNIGVPSYVDTGKYQVVCLNSGECYFGKVTSVTSDTVQIKNVFYVQKTSDATKEETSSDNNLQLIKLGNEVHGPEDMMAINHSQVLYIENLKSDGKVTQTINTYYQQNKQ